jgi:hypothetical protein
MAILSFHPKRWYKVQVRDKNDNEFIIRVKAQTSIHAANMVEQRYGKRNFKVVDSSVDTERK